MAEARICSVPGCSNEFHAKDLCHVHYKRALRRGEVVRTEFDNSGCCSVGDCSKQAVTKGLCKAHYRNLRTHGDPLGKMSARRFFKEVVLPYDGDDCLIWPFSRNADGYANFRKGETHSASRVVCLETHGPAPTPEHEAAHRCGKGHEGCVSPKHLRWATRAENEQDKVGHGTSLHGRKRTTTKRQQYLAPETVVSIRALEGAASHRIIAEKFGVSRRAVGMIIARQIHAGL